MNLRMVVVDTETTGLGKADRAIRNAGIIRAATGCPCAAAVASVRNTSQVQELVDSGTIHWHPLEDRGPAQVEE